VSYSGVGVCGVHGVNVGAETLRVLRTTIPFVTGVTNARSASGGVDAETVAEAKARAPLTLRTGRRAVTAGDVARLAREATGEVARSHCIERRDGTPRVRLLLVPAVTAPIAEQNIDHFILPDHVYETVERYLEPRRLIGTTIELSTPFYEGVSFAVLVRARDNVDPGVVEQRILETLYRYTHPLHGGPASKGIPWGWTLTSEDIRQLVTAMDGVAVVDDVAMFAADLRTGRRIGGSVESLTLGEDALFLGLRHRAVVR
jgi:predicted phage baseplate assembly protein